MGSTLSCVSSSGVAVQQPVTRPAAPARIIAADGSLKELPADSPLPSISDVLGSSGGAGAAPPSSFVCNSDALYFDEPPPALSAAERLRPGQMYFVLPAAMLGRRLSSADMAALAARAISALPDETPPHQHRRPGRVASKKKKKKQVRVMLVLLQEDGEDESVFHETLNELTLGEFTVLTSRARSGAGDKVAAPAGGRKTRSAALKRALSMIREDAD